MRKALPTDLRRPRAAARAALLAACAALLPATGQQPLPPDSDRVATPWLWAEFPPVLPVAPPADAPEADAVSLTPAMKLMFEGMINLQDGEFKIGSEKLERAITLDPSLLGAWEDLGWAYWKMDRPADAITLWERMRKIAPHAAGPLNLLGRAALAQGRLEDAESLFRQSLERNPYPFEPRLAHAIALARLGRARPAIATLQDLTTLEPDRLDVRIELAQNLGAIQDYEQAAAQWQIVCDALPGQPEFLREYALTLLYAGDLDEALATARRAVELDPTSLRGLTVLADIADVAAPPEETVDILRRIIELSGEPRARARLRMRLCERLLRLHRRDPERFPADPIIREAERALEDDDRLLVMRLFLGELHLLTRRFADAESLFRQVLENENARNQRARRGLLEVFLAQSRFDEADAFLEEIHDSANTTTRFLDRARLDFARGRYGEALRHLDRLEREAGRGAILCLGYGRLAASDWEPGLSARRFREHILALSRAGYTFITPDRIPAWYKSLEESAPGAPGPLPARIIRWLSRELAEPAGPAGRSPDEPARPLKVACITFDGAYRDTFRHATPVAEEFQTPFTLHLAAGERDRRTLGIASWEEIRPFAANPLWRFGSHGLEADILAPGFPDGYTVAPLPNRLWLESRGRLETLREWAVRIRREFRESRARLLAKLGLPPDQSLSVAYPFGDIGQAAGCNIPRVENVPKLLLDEAGLLFQAGFLPDPLGYALASDHPLALPRFQPDARDGGEDVLNHALHQHPLMLARRMRAEIAALQGKPWLAERQIQLLERDGYPPVSLEALRQFVRQRVGGLPANPESDPLQPEAGRFFAPSALHLGVETGLEEANRDYREYFAGLRAGFHLNPRTAAEAWLRAGAIEQETRSNRWFTISQTTVTETRTETVTEEDGGRRRNERITRREITRDVETNVVERAAFKADHVRAGVQITRWFGDGSSLLLHAGAARLDGDTGDKTLLLLGAAHRWKPFPSLEIHTAFDRDVVPSARAALHRSTLALTAAWLPRDNWEILASGAYADYADTNAMLHIAGQSLWLVGERQHLHAGLRAELVTMDDKSGLYWSPYWNQRLFLLARLARVYPRLHFEAELRVGASREKGRPDELAAWNDRRVRGEREGWDPGDKPGSGWEPVTGLGLMFRRRLGRGWELDAAGACSFYSDYSEYRVHGALRHQF